MSTTTQSNQANEIKVAGELSMARLRAADPPERWRAERAARWAALGKAVTACAVVVIDPEE